MSKPIPRPEGTPFEPRHGDAQVVGSARADSRGHVETSHGTSTPAPMTTGHPATTKEPIATKLAGLARQGNPAVAGGAMGPSNTHPHAPDAPETLPPTQAHESPPGASAHTPVVAPKTSKPTRPIGERE